MDIAPKLVLQGTRLGLRFGYRSLRRLHWYDIDRRDPIGAAQRNAPGGMRDTTRREWGGIWARHLAPLPSDVLKAQWGAGKNFATMKGHSLAEVQAYNEYSVQEGIYRPAGQFLQQIRDVGPFGDYARIYERLTSPVVDIRTKAEKEIINIFTRNWHRVEQMKHFLNKLHFEKKMAKKLEKVASWKSLVQMFHETVRSLNDGKMLKLFDKLLELLGDTTKRLTS